MRATAKASLTGIRGLGRSITKPPPGKPLKHVILSEAVRIRGDRIFPGAVAIVEALTAGVVAGTQPPPSEVDVIALLEEVNEAVKRGNRATAAVRAVRACLREGAVVPEVPVAEEEEAVVGLVVVAAVEGAPAAAVVAVGN